MQNYDVKVSEGGPVHVSPLPDRARRSTAAVLYDMVKKLKKEGANSNLQRHQIISSSANELSKFQGARPFLNRMSIMAAANRVVMNLELSSMKDIKKHINNLQEVKTNARNRQRDIFYGNPQHQINTIK
jgi:hypothetical protein